MAARGIEVEAVARSRLDVVRICGLRAEVDATKTARVLAFDVLACGTDGLNAVGHEGLLVRAMGGRTFLGKSCRPAASSSPRVCFAGR